MSAKAAYKKILTKRQGYDAKLLGFVHQYGEVLDEEEKMYLLNTLGQTFADVQSALRAFEHKEEEEVSGIMGSSA